MRNIGVIIAAAGSGKRLGGVHKPLIEVSGKPIIFHVSSLFASLSDVSVICIVCQLSDREAIQKAIRNIPFNGRWEFAEGGEERPYSVRNGFRAIRRLLKDKDYICIHDAARPLLHIEDLESVIKGAELHGAAFLAAPAKDTLKRSDSEGFSIETIDRDGVFGAQTPQIFRTELLDRAYSEVKEIGNMTDEVMLMEIMGIKVKIIPARHPNFKITTEEDVELLRKITS
ncbi:MAG: 2-C-methyl-D-erythritol 4-phosphate cytidylyltransferase [Candidatus Kryptoniota bacterium]